MKTKGNVTLDVITAAIYMINDSAQCFHGIFFSQSEVTSQELVRGGLGGFGYLC